MRLVRLQAPLVVILGLIVAVLIGVTIRQFVRLDAFQRQRAADLKSLHELQETLRRYEIQKSPTVTEDRTLLENARAALAKRDRSIELISRELSESRAHVARLQAQLLKSSDEYGKALASADDRYQKGQADWQRQLDALKRELDTTGAEAQTSRQRLADLKTANAEAQVLRQRFADLEAANAKVRREYNEGFARADEFRRVAVSLKEVDQRRDAYLSSVIRRYRDITAQFRAMSGMLGSAGEQNSNPCSGAALTRIQNAVSLADDDLQQLNNLNAQARQLEEKLVKK